MNNKGIILGFCFLSSFTWAMEPFRTPPSSPSAQKRRKVDIESTHRDRNSIALDIADLARQVENFQTQGLDQQEFLLASRRLMRRLDFLEPYATQYVDLARKVKKLQRTIISAVAAQQL